MRTSAELNAVPRWSFPLFKELITNPTVPVNEAAAPH